LYKYVTSGLYKGTTGKVISEKENSYLLNVGNGREAIVLKERCIDSSQKSISKSEKPKFAKVIPLFG